MAKGICFKEPLFRATIAGRKTQTRCIINPQPEGIIAVRSGKFYDARNTYTENFTARLRPRYNVGDVVYLKEPYCYVPAAGDVPEHYLYRFNGDSLPCHPDVGGWANKLFMPADAARYLIRIIAVRAERLQDISDEDCIKEGISFVKNSDGYFSNKYDDEYTTPRSAYAALIDRINGRGTWNSNPWVWVYDYELIENFHNKN